jgi:hypothetical protein
MAPPEVRGSLVRPSNGTTHHQPSHQVEIDGISHGTVQRLCDETEARIAQQSREADPVLLRRAQSHASVLREAGRTYQQRLHVIATVGISNMGPSLAEFFHDHENMRRAVDFTTKIAQLAQRSSTIDVLAHVSIRIIDVRNRSTRQWITSTCGDMLQAIEEYDAEISTLRGILADEVVRILVIWDTLSSIHLDDHELNNVGPDHNIDELGQDVVRSGSQRDTAVEFASELRVDSPVDELKGGTAMAQSAKGKATFLPTPPPSPRFASDGTVEDAFLDDDDEEDDDDDEDDYFDEDDVDRHCSICTEQYSEGHRAFSLTICGHTFGKACISRWVNSTSRNANTCPYCRRTLCKPRSLPR